MRIKTNALNLQEFNNKKLKKEKTMRLKNLIISVVAVASLALAMASCSDDDKDKVQFTVATPAERAAAFANLTKNGTSGTAQVYTQFYYDIDTLKAHVDWHFTNDTTVVFENVADSIFGRVFSPMSADELRYAVNAGSPSLTTVTGHLTYFMQEGTPYIVLSPEGSAFSIPYSGKTQDFTPLFAISNQGVSLDDSGKLSFYLCYAAYKLGSQVVQLNPSYWLMFR